MAQKRMFDKKVVGSDKFIDLPNSSKALYFMAGMEADDKGFFQPRRLQKMCGFSDDDFKILIAKRFFITFDSGVMVVTDWNKNNWLDSRRITETEYVDELNMLKLINQRYEFKLDDDIAKPMLSENSIEENSIDNIYNTTTINNINNDILLYSYVEKNFGRPLTPIEYEEISKWKDNELTRYAIKQTVLNGVYNIKYVNTILNSYKMNNIKSVQQAIERENKFKNRKNIEQIINKPEWVGKEYDEELASEEEIKELEEILK